MEWKIEQYKERTSTNAAILERAAGEQEGLVIMADRQTAGRGRRGRQWESPDGNAYFSLLLKPDLPVESAPMLTLVMAYSIATYLQEQQVDAKIKWPNDLVVEGKKICGILTEMQVAQGKIDAIVVGVGVNLVEGSIPPELSEKATTLEEATHRQWKKQEVVAGILQCFQRDYEDFLKTGDLAFLQEAYNTLLINRGRKVQVLEPGHTYDAYAKGINEKGELMVTLENGTEELVYAGEVSVRGCLGYV